MATRDISTNDIKYAAELCRAVYDEEPHVDGWVPLKLSDLDVPEGYEPDGRYVNENSLAFVRTTEVDGVTTLALTFKGTDLLCHRDWGDNILNINGHYEKLRPLVEAIDRYVERMGIERVLVTGHSLGGAMAEIFMDEHRSDRSKVTYHGVTFGSPGAQFTADTDDPRMLAFRHANDLVPKIASVRDSFGKGYSCTGRLIEVSDTTDRFKGMLGGLKAHGIVQYIETITQMEMDRTLHEVLAARGDMQIEVDCSADRALTAPESPPHLAMAM
ncbi:lipase family protein [Salipiger sp. PrR003]|uniref:lipase family protein n=1 Tax=Salipiger sp. PrR003 TaxID=2706776 RepID=UPI0013D97B03|nr:lipase family protein [Salipiger sp. PrR003]NDV50172.1 lipase family protein [Salipiger sp. PrR003]